MPGISDYTAGSSSVLLRFFSYIFLRWIPGSNIPIIVLSLFAVYLPSFIQSLRFSHPYDVVADEVKIIEKEVDPKEAGEIVSEYTNGVIDPETTQELDVQETIVLEERDPRILRTLLVGTPSPASLFWSAATFLLNALLVLMVVDLTWRGPIFHPSHDLSFARIGFVSDSSARVVIREPNPSLFPITIAYRQADARTVSWKTSRSVGPLDNSTDFTGTVTLTGLRADTRYHWTTSNNHTGQFATAPKTGSTSNRPETDGTYTFVHSSCLKNHFPYQPFAHALSNPGLQSFSKAVTTLGAQFMLFLGDFIYADVPLRHGLSADDFRREYRQVYASPDWPPATRSLPWIHVYDDHEVANDWSANTTGMFPAANDPYQHYHVSVNPPAARPGETYFSFIQGPATFFMLDTRRYRSPNDNTNGSDPLTGAPTKTMLGETQLSDLLAWLKRPDPPGVRWKILVSSIPFTKNWWFGAQDTWRGYLGERQIILEAMWDVGLRGGTGVVILSGDRHEFAATAFPPPPEGKVEIIGLGPMGVGAAGLNPRAAAAAAAAVVSQPDQKPLTRTKKWPIAATVHEFSASPLNMFYLPIRTYAEQSTSKGYVSDVLIKYLPDGNSKFGAVSIESPGAGEQSVLRYRLFVDGKEGWRYTVTTPPEGEGGGWGKDAVWG